MAKRLSGFRNAMRYLQNATGTTENQPPADSVLAKVNKVITGETKLTYVRATTSKPGSLVVVAIRPFGMDVTDNEAVRTTCSARTMKSDSEMATILAAAKVIAEPAAGFSSATRPPKGFRPAKATVFKPKVDDDPNSSPEKIPSKITGYNYNPRDGETYTMPFGQNTTVTYEGEAQALILTAVKALGTGYSVSFKPEVWKS